MTKTIVQDFISDILSSGQADKTATVLYQGKGFSLNDLYSQGHWKKRSSLKNNYSFIFKALMKEARLEFMDSFYLMVVYNSRLDVDNVSGMAKVFVDSLKNNYIVEDTKKYYKGLMIFPDSTLDKDSVYFILLYKNGIKNEG
jgi:hypothetical protein